MRAYKIKISLKDTELLIWRRIIVPAEITFKRLHDIIQISMGWRDNYLYDFNIIEEKLRVTGDEKTIVEYEFYSKKKLTKKNDPYGYVAKMLEITPKLSSDIKIDKYLSNYKNIEYVYDFGDYWKHNIILEEVLEDYENNYPVCIEGEGACPPEDIGGIFAYEQFLESVNDKSHPEHQKLKEWADKQHYEYIFDIESINRQMKDVFHKVRG
ncbi:plasmid pRiA4b ORF-3 family protein [Clostridium sp. OS1-26]|uniref:plasmid pRiA4b ORF-3 family protein n=1 Tax=Clostridium sp. OS1-26 TaxID=3070681 RepID=UPI0027DFD7A1|nr:plasmid pRiA4b ORF-3 family protein [Clostridium sp. OS1-26]WML33156.1 plasmid pRiA4b ORF-3 family protein [Clostridium sp. OS1-26]